MKLSELIDGTDVARLEGCADMEITNLDSDSRKITPGSLFVAIRGFETDGHKFIPAAAANGAAAFAVEEGVSFDRSAIPDSAAVVTVRNARAFLARAACNFYGNPSRKFTLVGITGTSGKTTTSFMLKKILEESGKKVGLIGTVAVYISGEKLKNSSRTTPESLELQRLFVRMADEGVDAVVMEVSSQSLKLDRVLGCDFDVGVFTNLSREHISKNEHPTMEDYFACKLKLFPMCRKVCTNTDDEKGREVAARFAPVISFGLGENCDVRGSDVELTNRYIRFRLTAGGETSMVTVPMPTRFSVYNALAASSAAFALGIGRKAVEKALSEVRVPGRSELVDNDRGLAVIIDYAHIADSMESILKEIRSATKGKLICVFGCGGDRDTSRRPLMGKVSGTLADMTILTQDNPRSERTEDIIADIEAGVKEAGGQYRIVIDRAEAIRTAIGMATTDDSVVLIGKGHETYQEIGHQKFPFDEREVVRRITGRQA